MPQTKLVLNPKTGLMEAREVRYRCRDCQKVFPASKITKVNSTPFCHACAADHAKCNGCGATLKLSTDKHYRYESIIYCAECIPRRTFTCPECGQLMPHYNSYERRGRRLCANCRTRYSYCEDCGNWVLNTQAVRNDMGVFCASCAPNNDYRRGDDRIGSCPALTFLRVPGEDTMKYLGVELEIDGGTFKKTVRELNHNFGEHIFLKYDGSLSDRGIEVVTHPATFKYHMDQLPWEDIILKCRQGGYSSHTNGRCGLHVHVSRKAFGVLRPHYEANVARLLYLVDNAWSEIRKFTRRDSSSLNRWAAHYPVDKTRFTLDSGDYYRVAHDNACGSRYRSVNLCPTNTIEFRLFRGSLITETVVGTIQLVNLLTAMATSYSNADIMSSDWSTVKDEASQYGYTEMLRYCERRGI